MTVAIQNAEGTKRLLTVFLLKDCDAANDLIMGIFSRTSDGGKTVGTIEVNLVKMGELEDEETDHITTDGQDQKVETQFIAQG